MNVVSSSRQSPSSGNLPLSGLFGFSEPPQTATYQSWIVREPNDDGIGEDAAVIAASGMWNDGKEGLSTISYIIEYSGVSP